MKVELLKDWAGHKKSALIEVTDKDVLKKGFEIKLFKEPKEEKTKKDANSK